jgi:hypothetical protein
MLFFILHIKKTSTEEGKMAQKRKTMSQMTFYLSAICFLAVSCGIQAEECDLAKIVDLMSPL